jgi:cysteine desulfurase
VNAVYLDHNATTPLDPRVWAAMEPYLRDHYANPSSIHGPGRRVRDAVEAAREQVAALVRAHPSQIIFTSGGTEANNLALKGVMAHYPGQGVAVSAIEHASVLAPARALAEQGHALHVIPVDGQGRVTAEGLAEAMRHSPRLVSIMAANNETGVVQDIASLGGTARRGGALFHCDAVQAAGRLPMDFPASGAQLMTLSSHKLYGPKGVGALIAVRDLELAPLLHGGGQERGLRGGTEHVAGIVGFGLAAELAAAEREARAAATLALRRHLEQRLRRELPEITLVAEQAERLPNTVMVLVPGIDGETLLMHLDQANIAVSSGSACAAGSTEPSHVLVAMGLAGEAGRSAIRISFGRDNIQADADALVEALHVLLKRLRGLSLTAWA